MGDASDATDVVARFVDACATDDRIVAAFLAGSHARGEADAHSDVDLGVVTTDEAFAGLIADRGGFVRGFGEPVFLEDSWNDRVVFFILADGTEGELFFGREGALAEIDVGPFEPLYDPRGVLDGAVFAFAPPDADGLLVSLRQILDWFWHELSHFVAAWGRGDLWWASGQLEAMRWLCVNLVRIEHGVPAQEEAYEKLAKAIPTSALTALEGTFGPLEPQAMLRAARDTVGFFRERAPTVAEAFGLAYPAELDRIVSGRLDELDRP